MSANTVGRSLALDKISSTPLVVTRKRSRQVDGYGLIFEALLATAVIGLGISYGSLYLFHLVLGCTVLRSIARPTSKTLFSSTRGCSRYHHFFAYMFAWYAVGIVWSYHRLYTLQYLGYIGIGSLLSVAIVKFVQTDFARLQRVLSIVSIFFAVDVGAGVLEALTPFRLPVSPFSRFSSHASKLSDMSGEIIKYLDSCPTGFHWNPNNFAVVMVLLLPFALLHRSLRVRVAGTSVLFGLVFATSSRGSLLAMACVFCLSPMFGKGKAWFVRICMLLAVGAILLPRLSKISESTDSLKLAGPAGTLIALNDYLFSDDDQYDQTSIGARRQLMHNGLQALASTGYIGVGGGADKAVQERIGVTEKQLLSMHNFWVELLVCGGAPFFAAFAVWYGRLAYELYRHSRRLPHGSQLRYCAAASSLALVGFIPAAISASSTIYMLPMYILFGFSIAVINVSRHAGGQGLVNSEVRRSRV